MSPYATILFAALMADSSRNAAPPAIRPEGVINAASQMPSQFQGGAIAPGSMFRILGVRLGPANGGVDGVSVRIRKGVVSIDAVLKSASDSRIDAILPASAPVGDAFLTVTYKGSAGAPFPVKIVGSSFGIFTHNGAGWGPATAAAVAPGGTISITGTGLGSERTPQVLLGGQPVDRIQYAGPSPHGGGEDEIRFYVPENAMQGCHVPVEVRSGGIASNIATVAIAPTGRPCAMTAPWLGSASLVMLVRHMMHSARFGDWTVDLVAGELGQSPSEGLASLRMLPPVGSCTAYARTIGPDEMTYLLELRKTDEAWLRIVGPKGSRSVTKGARGPFDYFRALGGTTPGRRTPPEPLFLEPGDYTVTGWGDRATGRFRARAKVTPPLVWTNRDALNTIDRRKNLTVAWDGADASELVLAIASNMDPVTGAMELCGCVARGDAGQFTIPAEILSRLPASTTQSVLPMNLLGLARIPARSTANGKVTAVFGSLESRTVDFR